MNGNFTTVSNMEYKRLLDNDEKFNNLNSRVIVLESHNVSLESRIVNLEDEVKVLKSRCTCA